MICILEGVFLVVRIASQSAQSVFKKKLSKKCSGCEFSTGAIIAFFALVYFLVFSSGFVFDWQILPYCIIFALCYAAATVSCVLALSCGSMALTELVIVYSTAIPLGYSIIFWGERLNTIQILGVALLAVSFLLTYSKSENGAKRKKIEPIWVVCAIILFVTNGMCGVVQQMQQRVFDAAYDDSFMIISLVVVTVLLVALAIIREGKDFIRAVRLGTALCAMSGACNGIMNYFALLCLWRVPGAIYYPLTSAGGLVLSYILSVTIFKEKFCKNQVIGFILSVVSIVLVNIN